MSGAMYDVSGIGSPLLDFTVETDYSMLEEFELTKGQMHLIDENKSREILKRLEEHRIETTPGGSSANTLAGIAILGGSGVLLGKVGNDHYGALYITETEKTGIKTFLSKHTSITGHAITFITPDSERTFATHLGAALEFRRDDVMADEIINSRILHVEGYLLEIPEIRDAAIYAMDIARDNNIKISIDLADPGLILRIRDVMYNIIKDYTNIVFVNEEEAKTFTDRGGEDALHILHSMCDVAVVKLGEKGSLIKMDDRVYRIPAFPVNAVNTNGAGDMYAAGVLYGLSRDFDIERAGKIGSYASSLVVSQTAARLKDPIDPGSIQ